MSTSSPRRDHGHHWCPWFDLTLWTRLIATVLLAIAVTLVLLTW